MRLGGGERALLLPGADSASASAVAEHPLRATRDGFANLPRGLTVSVGTAAAPDAAHGRELLHEADRALPVAKRSGRDRAVVHRPETIGALLDELGEPAAAPPSSSAPSCCWPRRSTSATTSPRVTRPGGCWSPRRRATPSRP